MTSKTILVTALALSGLLGCSRGTQQSSINDNPPNNAPVTLQVTNDNTQDVDVFATSEGGQRSRLGMVTSGQTQTFTVPGTAAHSAAGLQVLVHPIGGGGDYSTGPLIISPGDQVDLHVAPVVLQTSYMVAQRTN